MNSSITPQSVPGIRPMRHYCTLFNRNYLIKGLAMYRSLERVSNRFCLHILCMDDETAAILDGLELRSAHIIRLAQFETPELLSVKHDRTIAEYCWTCAPCLLCHVLDTVPEIDFLTYLDADLLFFTSPEPIFDEVGSDSTVIVEHRFSPKFEDAIINGRYNVQWVGVRRDAFGLETIRWWRDRCIEWCYYRLEDERMGDQKYLDQWTTRFKGVHELRHIGGGVAPWNFANYDIREVGNTIQIDGVPLIFYHFHSFRLLENNEYVAMPATYTESAKTPACIYDRYHAELLLALDQIRNLNPTFGFGIERREEVPLSRPTTKSDGTTPSPTNWKRYFQYLPAKIRNLLKR